MHHIPIHASIGFIAFSVDWVCRSAAEAYNLIAEEPEESCGGVINMSIAEKAKEFDELELRDQLEAAHRDELVAIEPMFKAFSEALLTLQHWLVLNAQ